MLVIYIITRKIHEETYFLAYTYEIAARSLPHNHRYCLEVTALKN
jgi:hypothetical protein